MNWRELRNAGVIAAHEFVLMMRTRWIGGFGLLFMLLAMGFAWFGTANLGLAGIQDFSRTTVTLVNLVCVLVPLMALLVGVHGFTLERGSDELLFTQPIRRSVIVIGKGAGLFATLAVSTLIGFGLAGSLISYRVGTDGILSYIVFIALALVLELCFLSIALLISSLLRQRMRAIGAALATWVFFVLLYDLAVIGSTLFLRGPVFQKALFVSVLFNPVDMIRVSQLIALDGPTFFGPVGAVWVRFLGGETSMALLLAATVALWVALPGLVAIRRVRKMDF